MPQKSWPTVQMSSTILADDEVSAVVIIGIDPPPAFVIPASSFDANISASSTIQPAIAEKKIERHTPRAALIAAPRVSSAVCAEAS